MAAAEARAVWKQTANRYFDAKRAPKLSCSISSLLSKQVNRIPDNVKDVNDGFSFLDQFWFSNLLSDSRWWVELQPTDYIYQRGLTNEQVNALEARQFIKHPNGSGIHPLSKESYEMESVDFCKELNQQFEKKGEVQLPWWQKEELGSYVFKRTHDLHKGSKPQNAISRVQVSSKPISPLGMANSNCSIGHQGPREKPISEVDSSKSKILEALRHSQTRAREAENAANEAYAEKEHVVKLLFRQASQLFAYRQWLYLLQLDNLYYQIKNNKTSPDSKTAKLHKNLKKRKTRTRDGVGQYEHDIGKYAFVFVMGLGLVGAGLLLGWTVGWMLI